MSIRYVDRWESPSFQRVSVDCFAFRITDLTDFAALPTPTKSADVVDGDATVAIYADVGSEVLSDDMTIVGELQSDLTWHRLGGV